MSTSGSARHDQSLLANRTIDKHLIDGQVSIKRLSRSSSCREIFPSHIMWKVNSALMNRRQSVPTPGVPRPWSCLQVPCDRTSFYQQTNGCSPTTTSLKFVLSNLLCNGFRCISRSFWGVLGTATASKSVSESASLRL